MTSKLRRRSFYHRKHRRKRYTALNICNLLLAICWNASRVFSFTHIVSRCRHLSPSYHARPATVPVTSVLLPRRSSICIMYNQKGSEEESVVMEKENDKDEKKDPSFMTRRDGEERREQSRKHVNSLALWEVFRELEEHGVLYNVLQPREDLNQLVHKARMARGRNEEEEDVKEKEDVKEHTSVDMSTPPLWQISDEVEKNVTETLTPVFRSTIDALAWAAKLSEEELRIELDFLGIKEDMLPEGSVYNHAQLARLLARTIMNRNRGRDIVDPPSLSVVDEESDEKEEEMLFEARRRPTAAKSRARQKQLQSMMAAQHIGNNKNNGNDDSSSAFSSASVKTTGSRDKSNNLDIKHAQEELMRLRARAKEIKSSSSKPPKNVGGGGAKTTKKKKAMRPGSSELDGERDVAVRAFEKMSTVADKALTWTSQAKSMARGAMLAASSALENGETERSNEKERKAKSLLPSSRGRRWSKFGGLMIKAWLESAWQVVMASASWAGGGLLPGKYVLMGVGAFTLLMRRGLATYMATLLVVRTCSSTLRNMMEDEGVDEALDF